jgi:urease accessory protein UreF
MKKNLLAENYKRLFKARLSSNDSKLLKEAIDSTPLGDPKVKNALKKLLNARKRNSEDETTHDQMEQYLVQLFTKMKLQDPESFASYMMEDEEFATGTVDGMISSIEFALEDEI